MRKVTATSRLPTLERSSGAILNALLAAAAIGFAVVTFILVLTKAVDVPFWDEWEWGDTILSYHAGTLTFTTLWAQHNEHRMFFPQVAMLLLDSLGYWSQRRECLFSVAVVTGSLWLLWRIARRTLRPRAAFTVIAIGSLVLFSPSQEENWLWGFQTAWFLVDLAVLGGALLLSQAEFSASLLLAEGALSALAAFSCGFGLAILPAVAVGLFIRRREIGSAAFLQWVVVSLVIAGLYLWGWHAVPIPGAIQFSFLSGLRPRALEIAVVAGLPVGMAGGLSASAAIGSVGFILAALYVVLSLRDLDDVRNARTAPWIAVLVYGVCASALIGYGRADLGPEAALSSRYVTCSLMLWLGLLGLVAVRPPWNAALLSTRAARALLIVGALALSCFLLGTWAKGAKNLFASAAFYRERNEVLANYWRAQDSDLLTLYVDANTVRTESAALSRIGQLPEVQPPPEGLAEPIAEARFAQGYVDDAVIDQRSKLLTARGWAVSPLSPSLPRHLMVTLDGHRDAHLRIDENVRRDDVVVALGLDTSTSPGFEFALPISNLRTGWHQVEITLQDSHGVRFRFPSEIKIFIANGSAVARIVRLNA
ncbi:MAG: hypothetical protein WAJ85_11880 [Candidatus Baltobacteraceae bacterium]